MHREKPEPPASETLSSKQGRRLHDANGPVPNSGLKCQSTTRTGLRAHASHIAKAKSRGDHGQALMLRSDQDRNLENRLSALHWWAHMVNRQSIMARDNTAYGIGSRPYAARESKAQVLDEARTLPKRGASAWRGARDRTSVPALRVHDLRHNFGHGLRAAGVGFEDRQDLLRHMYERITRFSHNPSHKMAAVG